MPATINRPRARALIRRALGSLLIAMAAQAAGAAAFAGSAGAATIAATASPEITLGAGVLRDFAIVTGRVDPQANSTVLFRLFGPDDPTCSGPALVLSPIPYPQDGAPMVNSGSFTPTRAGTYRWIASYTGDANNAGATTTCDDPAQDTFVNRATTVVNVSPAAANPGGAVTLTNLAGVADRISPVAGATIDFRLYGPTDTGCTGAPVFESLGVPYPAAGGAVSSAPYAPPTPGVYRWTASYSGDANNAPAVSGCSAPTNVASNEPPPCPTCAPRNSLPPVIGGRATRGKELECGAGVWTGVAPIAFAYRWLRDGTQIAVGQKYKVVTADLKKKLVCEVTATNMSGTATARSASVTPVAISATVPISVGGPLTIRAPAGVSARKACSGRITLTLQRGSRTLGRRTVRLNSRCRWSHTFRVSRTKLGTATKLRLKVRFGGNRYARPVTFVRTIRLQRD
jgi:hypothetical protein